ncbi:MAG: hypothetical protein HY066_14100 [Betaproteobacteria bacterium]|nr:hypothetical protein [Betaproteobacteria bacterium]
MHPNLTFEQAPPISVPYRFFLTAPLFGVAAGLMLAWLGAAALESRWTPGALALTHLLTVGYMLQAMCGALLQFVPVSTGGNIWRPKLVAAVVHPLLALAALLLALAFVSGRAGLFQAAGPLFAVSLGGFLTVVAVALLHTQARSKSLDTLRLAIFGLLVTATLGMFLAIALGWQTGWPLLPAANVHAVWGLGGWALMLLMGVSILTVPMFQLTPPYPGWLARWLPPGLLLLLCLWSLQLVAGDGVALAWQSGVALTGLLLAALYASTTLWLQARRRRRLVDVTFLFWRGAMWSLLALAVSWVMLELPQGYAEHPRAPQWLGMLALVGVFVSAINGMFYKIVPFLNWLHLQRLGGLKVLPPNIKQMIPEPAMRGQMKLHFVALGLLLAAVLWPPLARVAGLAFAASCLWLEWNLVGAARFYAVFRKQVLIDRTRADVAGRES